jgi:hypothetical protein
MIGRASLHGTGRHDHRVNVRYQAGNITLVGHVAFHHRQLVAFRHEFLRAANQYDYLVVTSERLIQDVCSGLSGRAK